MTLIAAKPTLYKGARFRSRLEARWAVFFDSLGIEWTYEPVVPEATGYLPDFDIVRCFVEVKSRAWAPATDDGSWEDRHLADFERWTSLVAATKKDLLLCVGEPMEWEEGRMARFPVCMMFQADEDSVPRVRWTECSTCRTLTLAEPGRTGCECPQVFGQLQRAYYDVRDFTYEDAP